MNKKFLIGIGIMFIGVIFIIIKIIIPNNELSKLTKYTFTSNEEIRKKFNINKRHYLLTTYYNDSSTYGFNNILYEKNQEYYLLDVIKKCDMNYYILNNEIYIHCSGKKGDILKYTINKYDVKKEVLQFNYYNTPNISQLHLAVEGIDSEYIYLKSYVKLDTSIDEGEHVKCSLTSRICEYYNGNIK